MQRLFKVIIEGKPEYFDNKKLAKIRRDRALGPDAHLKGGVIMRGPDHWKGESYNVSKKTASSKKQEVY